MIVAALVLAAALSVSATPQEQVYDVGSGVTAPEVVREVKPAYTAGAMQAKVHGSVFLNAVVLSDGRVDRVKVVKPLHPELDEQAVKALRQWEFKPGTREGKPVAVRITCELTFTLKK